MVYVADFTRKRRTFYKFGQRESAKRDKRPKANAQKYQNNAHPGTLSNQNTRTLPTYTQHKNRGNKKKYLKSHKMNLVETEILVPPSNQK